MYIIYYTYNTIYIYTIYIYIPMISPCFCPTGSAASQGQDFRIIQSGTAEIITSEAPTKKPQLATLGYLLKMVIFHGYVK